MMRSEIIPQKAAGVNLGQGHLYYHFSVSTRETNAPHPGLEHQIAFFEVPPSAFYPSCLILCECEADEMLEPLHRTQIRPAQR